MKKINKKVRNILETSICEAGFSRRVENSFIRARLRFVGDVVRLNEGQLLRIPGVGVNSLNEVKKYAETVGLVIGNCYD